MDDEEDDVLAVFDVDDGIRISVAGVFDAFPRFFMLPSAASTDFVVAVLMMGFFAAGGGGASFADEEAVAAFFNRPNIPFLASPLAAGAAVPSVDPAFGRPRDFFAGSVEKRQEWKEDIMKIRDQSLLLFESSFYSPSLSLLLARVAKTEGSFINGSTMI